MAIGEDFAEMHKLADKHLKLTSEEADGFRELIDVILEFGAEENYSNDGLIDECIKRGLKIAEDFNHYSQRCFYGETQLSKGADFTAAVNGCKKCLASDDFDLENYQHAIKNLNTGLTRLNMQTLKIPQ